MKENNYEKIVELYHMLGDDENLLSVFYTNDYAVPFKSLKLYPIQVDLFFFFQLFSQCLEEPHRTSGDMKAISMSYLQFICYLATEKNRPELLVFLTELLSIVCRVPSYKTNEKGDKISNIEINLSNYSIRIGEEVVNSEEFDKMRKIILEQNGSELPDESLNPELVKAYKEIEEFKRKKNNIKLCDFEEQINVVVAQSSCTRDEILQMTIRSFMSLFERLMMITEYKIKSLLSPYMEKKDIGKIVHYLTDTHKTLKERIESETTNEQALRETIEGKQG